MSLLAHWCILLATFAFLFSGQIKALHQGRGQCLYSSDDMLDASVILAIMNNAAIDRNSYISFGVTLCARVELFGRNLLCSPLEAAECFPNSFSFSLL